MGFNVTEKRPLKKAAIWFYNVSLYKDGQRYQHYEEVQLDEALKLAGYWSNDFIIVPYKIMVAWENSIMYNHFVENKPNEDRPY